MADNNSAGSAPIEGLLQERARFQEWLAKLDAAAGSAPVGVRQKVRADYEGRLQTVIDQLKSHAATIQDELDRFRRSQRDLDGRKVGAEEALAEAQVRYAVGEYSEEEWGRLNTDGTGTLETLQRELDQVESEIARLVEVQGLITAPAPEPVHAPEPIHAIEPVHAPEPPAPSPQARPAPPIEMLPDPTPDVAAASISSLPADPVPDIHPAPPAGAPRFVPKPAAEAAQARPAAKPAAPKPSSPPLDELAFLKSVAGDKSSAGEDRKPRRSGETARPAEPVATSAPPAQPSAKPGQASQSKTLKCGECGTLNRPTEWYCERCGAELAAL